MTFVGSKPPSRKHAFCTLEHLFNELGLESSPSKDCSPSTRMVFLGLTNDTVKMSIEVPPDKLHNTFDLVHHWLTIPQCTKSDLQSLIGKLFYICACISRGRIFMMRLLNELCQLPTKRARFVPSSDKLPDLHWWYKVLSVYNGVSLLRSLPWPVSDHYFCTDACAAGIGGFFHDHFHSSFLACIDPTSLSIASLEVLAVIVIIKLCSDKLRGLRILAHTDNLNTELAITTGHPCVPFIQSCLRDLWFYSSLCDFELPTFHIPGYANVIAAALSRWDTHPLYRTTFFEAASLHYDTLTEFICPSELFRFECLLQSFLNLVAGLLLDDLQLCVTRIQALALSDSTKCNYHSVWNTYLKFCQFYSITSFPATSSTIASFFTLLSFSVKSHRTVNNYLSALRHVHVFCHFDSSAFDDIHVKLTQTGLEKSMVHLPHRKAPLTPAILLQFYCHLNICNSAYLASPLIKSCPGVVSLLPAPVPSSQLPAPKHLRLETLLSSFQFLVSQDLPSTPELPCTFCSTQFLPQLATLSSLTLLLHIRMTASQQHP